MGGAGGLGGGGVGRTKEANTIGGKDRLAGEGVGKTAQYRP